MDHTWQDLSSPFKVGIHTRETCARIDKAIADFREGKSSFLVFNMPFRHGKSEISSKSLVPHFNGEFPECETLTLTHSADLSYDFSKTCRNLIQTDEYKELYPNVQVDPKNKSVKSWGIQKICNGEWKSTRAINRYFGIQGGVAGRGGKLIVVDDLYKTRADAESETIRNKILQEFKDGVFTRRSDPSIVIIVTTRWHVEDVTGWLKSQVKKDPDFPKFEFFNFPGVDDSYESGTLFPEVYSKEWYDSQVKVLGPYAFNSLMQGDPSYKGKTMFRVDFLEDGSHIYEQTPNFKDIIWTRGWDLASSKKQTDKEDPDYSVGIRLGVYWKKIYPEQVGIGARNFHIRALEIPILYIDDMISGQWEAPERDEMIKGAVFADGGIPVNIEAVAAYKDAYTTMSKVLKGICEVNKILCATDKVTKAGMITPAFQLGNVWMKKAWWNDIVTKQLKSFPGGKHDDIYDAIIAAFGDGAKRVFMENITM
jgi:predicted phage terminase large subunit-like protein